MRLLRDAVCVSLLGHEPTQDLGTSRSRQDGVDGDARARDRLGKPAGDRELCGLGHAVVEHFLGDVDCRLTADEHDFPRAHLIDCLRALQRPRRP